MGNEYENLKRQRYLQLVQQCAQSGKSKREWCRENGIKFSTFMRWQKALREELAGEVLARQEIVPVQIIPTAGVEGSGGYDPEEVSRQRVSEIQIQVGSIEVYLPRDTPPDYLAALVKEMA